MASPLTTSAIVSVLPLFWEWGTFSERFEIRKILMEVDMGGHSSETSSGQEHPGR